MWVVESGVTKPTVSTVSKYTDERSSVSSVLCVFCTVLLYGLIITTKANQPKLRCLTFKFSASPN